MLLEAHAAAGQLRPPFAINVINVRLVDRQRLRTILVTMLNLLVMLVLGVAVLLVAGLLLASLVLYIPLVLVRHGFRMSGVAGT